MQKKLFFLSVVLLMLLAACGGSSGNETAATPAESNTTDSSPTEEANEEVAAEPTEAPAEPTAETSAESTEAPAEGDAESTSDDTEPAPEESSDPTADLLMSGTDPDTGLEINPEQVVAGVEFVVRGELASMTLIPQDKPEFVILAPNGKRYRFRPQPLAEIFYVDGTQPAAHDYQLGMIAGATIYLDPAGGSTAIATSTNMVLYSAGD